MKNLKRLTILHSNDMHGDFLAEQIDERLVGGVSLLSGYVNKVRLADAGVIEIGAGKGRAITLTHPAAPSVPEPEEPADRVPIVGNVAAGSPILAQECIEDYLTFHTGHPGDVHFALRVRGESMLNAGILPGDLVVVRQQQTCNQGEIVVAMIDDEATVKRFSRKNGHIWLLPENDDYEPIDGTYAQILGKVVAVVRQY